jgi:hypothetical protein
MLKEIVQHIHNADIGFVKGGNLRTGELDQDAPQNCLAVLDDVGGEGNFYLPDNKKPMFHFISRHENINTCREWIYLIYNLYQGKAQIILPVVTAGEKYTINTADADTPFFSHRDEKRLPIYKLYINFNIKDFDT